MQVPCFDQFALPFQKYFGTHVHYKYLENTLYTYNTVVMYLVYDKPIKMETKIKRYR